MTTRRPTGESCAVGRSRASGPFQELERSVEEESRQGIGEVDGSAQHRAATRRLPLNSRKGSIARSCPVGGRSEMRKSATWVQVIGLAVVAVFSSCRGGADHAAPHGGNLWGGPRLTGDWFGGRDWLSKHGVDLDLDLTQVLQGVARGGSANRRNAG